MRHFAAESSVINHVYRPNNDVVIKFHGGTFYRYKNVPENVFEAFANAESKGVFFNKYIKNIYDFCREFNFTEPQDEPEKEETKTVTESNFAEFIKKIVSSNAGVTELGNIIGIVSGANLSPITAKTAVGSKIKKITIIEFE